MVHLRNSDYWAKARRPVGARPTTSGCARPSRRSRRVPDQHAAWHARRLSSGTGRTDLSRRVALPNVPATSSPSNVHSHSRGGFGVRQSLEDVQQRQFQEQELRHVRPKTVERVFDGSGVQDFTSHTRLGVGLGCTDSDTSPLDPGMVATSSHGSSSSSSSPSSCSPSSSPSAPSACSAWTASISSTK
jgi:hypothetical protein